MLEAARRQRRAAAADMVRWVWSAVAMTAESTAEQCLVRVRHGDVMSERKRRGLKPSFPLSG